MGKQEFKKDPVCGKKINRNRAHIVIEYENHEYLVCCPMCQSVFERDPQQYAVRDNKKR